jgi:hypothetical protein
MDKERGLTIIIIIPSTRWWWNAADGECVGRLSTMFGGQNATVSVVQMHPMANRDFEVGRHRCRRQVVSHLVWWYLSWCGVPGRWYSKGRNGRLMRKIERMMGTAGKDFRTINIYMRDRCGLFIRCYLVHTTHLVLNQVSWFMKNAGQYVGSPVMDGWLDMLMGDELWRKRKATVADWWCGCRALNTASRD